MRYWSRQRCMNELVDPVIADFADDYDPEKLARAFEPLIVWQVDRDELGRDLLNTEGFELIATDEQFWAAIESAAIVTDDDEC